VSEILTIGYKRLFEIRLLHHYWLDEGIVLIDNLSAGQQEKRLLNYDRRPFLNIEPTTKTANLIKGLRGVYKDTALGGVVVIPNNVPVADDAVFEFVVSVQHRNFDNYTAHSFYSRNIYEIPYAPDEKIYRFKENVFVLKNTSGSNTPNGLFLSQPFPAFVPPATNYPVEALLLSAGNITQVTNEIGGTENIYPSVAASDCPVFLHQSDIPIITPPVGMLGAPAKGILLNSEIPDNVYALIQIRAVHPTDTAMSCTTGGLVKPTAPVFEVRFKNRRSVWRYKSKTNPALPSTELGSLPLTFFGSAATGANQKPSEGTIKVEFDQNTPPKKITKIISEIYQ
jgi:hypothetical protein